MLLMPPVASYKCTRQLALMPAYWRMAFAANVHSPPTSFKLVLVEEGRVEGVKHS